MKYTMMLGLSAAFLLGNSGCAEDPVPVLAEIDYEGCRAAIAASQAHDPTGWTYLVDVRDAASYDAGYIQNAINIPYDHLLDDDGSVVEEGDAVPSVVAHGYPVIVYSQSDDGRALAFARAMQTIGYDEVHYYPGGVEDWRSLNRDYLCIGYAAFKSWYDAHHPFDEGTDFLIDVDLPGWYSGATAEIGHIPDALNLPIEEVFWLDENDALQLVDEGAALIGLVPDSDAVIVFYNVGRVCPRSGGMVQAARLLGYTNVFRFERGLDQWMQNGNEAAFGTDP